MHQNLHCLPKGYSNADGANRMQLSPTNQINVDQRYWHGYAHSTYACASPTKMQFYMAQAHSTQCIQQVRKTLGISESISGRRFPTIINPPLFQFQGHLIGLHSLHTLFVPISSKQKSCSSIPRHPIQMGYASSRAQSLASTNHGQSLAQSLASTNHGQQGQRSIQSHTIVPSQIA